MSKTHSFFYYMKALAFKGKPKTKQNIICQTKLAITTFLNMQMVPKVYDIRKSMYIITYIDKILPNLIKEQTPIQEGKGKFLKKQKGREEQHLINT